MGIVGFGAGWGLLRRVAQIFVAVAIAWFVAPAIGTVIVGWLGLSKGSSVNLHVYGSARWLGAATAVAVFWSVDSNRLASIVRAAASFFAIFCTLMLLNLLGGFKLWAEEKTVLWPLETSLFSLEGTAHVPGYLLFPWIGLPKGTLPFSHLYHEIVLCFFVSVGIYIFLILVSTLFIRRLLRFTCKSDAGVLWPVAPLDRLALALCLFALCLDWYVIIGFPFGSASGIVIVLGVYLFIPLVVSIVVASWLIAKLLRAISDRPASG